MTYDIYYNSQNSTWNIISKDDNYWYNYLTELPSQERAQHITNLLNQEENK